MQIQSTKDHTCTREHYCFSSSAVLEHARLDTLATGERHATRTCRAVARRDMTSQVEFWLNILSYELISQYCGMFYALKPRGPITKIFEATKDKRRIKYTVQGLYLPALLCIRL